MTIYSPSDTALLTIPFNTGCIRRRVLMKDDYITVKFSLAEPKHFGIGCYVSIPNEGRFEIIKEQKPTYNGTTGGYDYELTFCAEYLKWQNKIFFYSPENASREAAWSLTAPIDIHLGVFLRNLTANGFTYNGKAYSWTVDSTFDSAEAKFIQYNATNLIDALTAIADAWACEWWITDNVIHFGTCRVVSASKPPIEVSNGVNADISATESSAEYATRLYVFGSERNLPVDYRKGDATLTVEGVVQRRLMLPEGTPYIDAKANMETSEIVEKVITIDSIYPKTNGKIAEVVPYVAKVTDENNNEVEQTFYRFKDASLTFSADYLLKDQTLGVIFTSGRLNGLQFDAVFNPNGVAEKLKDGNVNPDAQLFEIVANENYGLELPAGSMIPQAGDTYVLIGWDTTKIASLGLVAQAEAALLAEGRAQLTKMNVDPATYNCTIYADTAKAACATNDDGYIFPYGIGEPVMLKDNAYFSNGSRLSRIIGYEYPLDIPFDNPELIVGEAASYSRIGALESEVANIAMGGNTLSASGGSSNVYIIGTNDRTLPTNSNVYSALRTSKSFLSKTGDDHTTGKLSVDGGIVVNEGGRKSARIDNNGEIYAQHIYSNGDVMGDTLTFHRLLQAIGDIVHERTDIYDMEYIPGFDGYGWGIKWDKSNVHAEFDTLTIRKALTVYELIIQKIRSVGGAIICSAANGKIKSVTTSGDNYVITFEDECQFQADDLMRCQTFTGGTLKSYWVRITSATTESVTVAKSEFGSATPEAGDECVLMGNATNDKRQSAIYISAAEDGRPVIDILNGIKSASTAGCLRGRFGALDGINDSAFPADRQPQGYGLYSGNAYLKGEFILASTGENVSTLFEATNGKITAEITSVKGDINKVQDNVDKVWQDTESALNVLDGEIQTNTTSINGLNQQIKDDYDKLNDGLSSLGDSIGEISGNLTAAEDRLNGKIDAANDKIAEVDGKVDTADGKITEITTNYEVLSTRVEQTEANITLQAQSIKSVTTRVTQTESDITAANDRITETDKAVSNANEAIGDLDAKVDANQETITETITAMEARFNVRADEISSSVSAVTSEVTTVKTTVESVQSDVSSVTTKVDNVTSAVEDVTTEVNTVKTDVGDLQTDVSTVKDNVSTITTDVANVKTDVGSVKTDIGDLQDDVSTVKTDVSTVKTNVGSIQTDVKTAQDAIEKAQTDIANVDKSITNINGNITTINGSITTINGNIDDINGNLDTFNGSLTTLRTDLDSNVKDLDNFKTDTNAQFGTVNDSIAGVNKNVTDLETATNDKIAGVNSNIVDLKTNTDKSIQNINDNLAGVNGEIEQVRGTANTANTTANNANTKADNAQKTANDANTKADNVAKQQETITETITSMKSDFNVRADKIESQVTKVSKSISSSGRNMLLNTNQGTTNWRYADNSGVAYTQTSTERGGYRITRPSAGRKASWEQFLYSLRPQLIITGQIYTLSFKVTNKTSETAKTQFDTVICNSNSRDALTNKVGTQEITGTDETQFVITLKAKASGTKTGAQVVYIAPKGECVNNWTDIEIRDLQLERGEIATEYMPSNEDYVNETKETLSSSITQTAEEIRSEVSKQITDSESKITTEYTSAIKQSADNINLSVTSLETDVNSMQDDVDAINSGLKTTGIDITTGKVTISADEVTFTNSSGTKQALLTNGKLNAKALESESLTVQNGANASQRIEVLPQSGKFGMNIYNGSTLVQSLTADTYNNGASDLFAKKVGALSISNPSGSANTGIASTTTSPVVLLSPRKTTTSRTVFITGGTLTATAKCSIPTSSSGLQQTYQSTANITLDLQHSSTSAFTSDVTTINLSSAQAQVSSVGVTSAQTQTNTTNTINAMGTVPAGRYYRVVVSFVKTANGTPTSKNSASVSWSSISAQTWSHEYLSRHFANGIVLGSSLKDFFDVHYDSNDAFTMRMETGGSGLLVQTKTDEYTNDMAILIGGYQAPMQRLICHGFVKYIAKSGYKMYYHGLRINSGTAVTLKYPSGGTYRTMLAFSNNFKALLERLLGEDYTENNDSNNAHYCGLEKHLFCHINTRSTTNTRVVTSLTTDGFITDAVGAYEDFTFDIYFV